MKVLVTGGTGFLGTHLIPRLMAQGHQVRMIGRTKPAASNSAPPKAGFAKAEAAATPEFLQGDLKNVEVVKQAIEGVEAIIHLAGLVSFKPEDGRKMYELHVEATRSLLRSVQQLGTRPRIVLMSTSGAIAVSKTERVGTEDDDYPIETVGRWPYYLSKIYEEKLTLEYCKKHQIPAVVLNPSLLMGPGDDRLSSTWTVVKFLQRDIPALPTGGMCIADARDVADATVNALTRGELYGRHLMGTNLTMKDFFGKLERLTGVPAPRLRLPKAANVLGAYALEAFAKWRGTTPTLDPHEVEIGEHWFWLDSAKAERELGYQPRDVFDTLNDTVQYTMSKLAPGSLPGTKGRLAELRGEG